MQTGEAGLGTVLEQVTRLMRQLTTAGDLSLTAAMVLARLELDGPQRLTELAIGEGMSQPGMTQLITRLERDGLVRRTASAGDRRGVLVAVTEAGAGLLADRRAQRTAALEELLGRLRPDDRAAIAHALPALARLVEAGTTPPITTRTEHTA